MSDFSHSPRPGPAVPCPQDQARHRFHRHSISSFHTIIYLLMYLVTPCTLPAVPPRIKRAIASIDIPGLTKPHAFVTPLHLAGRTGQVG